jgi:molecular chaperone GrpE (heat shock protein)
MDGDRTLSQRLDAAFKRGQHEMAASLLEVVDDCDRAIATLGEAEASGPVLVGLDNLRARLIAQFARHGFTPFSPLGEQFDVARHEAIALEPGAAAAGSVLRVHRRGWEHNGEIIQPAAVIVCQGDLIEEAEAEAESAAAEAAVPGVPLEADLERRRRRSPRTARTEPGR